MNSTASHYPYRVIAAALVLSLLMAGAASAHTADNTLPPRVRGIGIDQKIGAQVPTDLVFHDESGNNVRLGQYFDGRRPVILTLVYYECPMLCTIVLNQTAQSLRQIPLSIGDDFQVVTVSFNPRETPQLAAAKKQNYLREYGRKNADAGWHFLTGDEPSIHALTESVGFHYKFDAESNQYFHPAGLLVLTPQGKVARYFFGIAYEPRDVRLSLLEASNGQIGSATDQLLLYCFHYDPATGRYGWAVMNAVRAGGALTALGLVGLVTGLLRRERRRNKAAAQSPTRPNDTHNPGEGA